MLLIKNLELISANKKNPFLKQHKTNQLQIKELSNLLSDISELKTQSIKTNQLLKEIKESLISNQISFTTTHSNIQQSEQSKNIKQSKEYIPNPNISKITTSNKKIKNQIIDSNDLQDTLKSLSKIQN